MDKKVTILCLVFMAAHFQLLFSQNASNNQWKLTRYELSGGLATCNYFGDIGGSASADNLFGLKDIDLLSSRPSAYVSARYYLSKRIAITPSFMFGLMHGTDEKSFYTERGYGFNTFYLLPKLNVELSLIVVNDLFGKKKLKLLEYSKSLNKTFVLYFTCGAGYALYNVNINDKMNEYVTNNAGDEQSQRVISSGWSGAMVGSAGLGIKYFFVHSLAFFTSIEYHNLLADNLDGFKTETSTNDIFYVTSFGLSYRLPTNQWGRVHFSKKPKD